MGAARNVLIPAALFALTSCGSSQTNTPASPTDAGGGQSTTEAGGGGGDAGSQSPATGDATVVTSDAVTFTMGPFMVEPGTEVFKCQDFANPFGADQDISQYESHMTPGSHHMFIFFNDANAPGDIQDCPAGGLEFHPYPFSAQTRDGNLVYPKGVGSLIPAKTGFRLNAHYINSGASPMEGKLTVTLHKAPVGSVQQHAGVIFMNDARLQVPPGESTSKATCEVPGNINIMAAASHMHQRAKAFSATTKEGTMLYETKEWADPAPRIFAPAMPLATTNVTWGCTYDNETSQTLTFGEFAQTNVMCIFTMHYYPVADPQNPTIACQKF